MAETKKKVTIVTVTYQSSQTIGPSLDELKKSYDKGIAEVVIVDNVSMDGTADMIAKKYPWVALVRNTENVGFGRGCNLGFKYVKTPYVMFLNPDAVIDLQSLTKLIAFMDQNPRVGMCGPVLKSSSGDVRSVPRVPTPWSIIAYPLFGKWISRGQGYVYPGDAPIKTEWIRGVCMLLRKEAFESINGFDPRFFLYFEETDLCIRITRSGWEIWIVGDAICEHVNAASAKQTKAPLIFGDTISEHYFKSRLYYMIKHHGWFLGLLAEIGEIVFMSIRAVLNLVRRKSNEDFHFRLQAPILKLPSRIKTTVD